MRLQPTHGQRDRDPATTTSGTATRAQRQPVTVTSATATAGEAAILRLQELAGNKAVTRAVLQRTVDIQEPQRFTYNIEARNLAGAVAAMAEHNPEEAAETEWQPTFSTSDNGRTVTDAAVTVPITVEMPNWPGVTRRSAAVQAEWARFLAALGRHEDQHVALGRQGFRGADRRLVGKRTGAVDATWQAVLAAVQRPNDQFDRRTDHGRRAGTEINESIV